jgi:hypothetical protein
MTVNPDSYELERANQKEAKRKLDEVRKRYGIHLAVPQTPPAEGTNLITPMEPVKPEPPAAVRVQPSVPITPLSPVKRMRSDPAPQRGRMRQSNVFPSDIRSYHYLIRIAECASLLHCEVEAENDAAARERVGQIPNLMEWREISFEELAEIMVNERAI